jgi:hypothetical protein
MRMFVFGGLIAGAGLMLSASTATAQSVGNCGCGGSVSAPIVATPTVPGSSYQRFSYEPSPMVTSPTASSAIMQSQPTQSLPQYSPLTQTYRRFSYQPSVNTRSYQSSRKEPWQYSKADPRKYRP